MYEKYYDMNLKQRNQTFIIENNNDHNGHRLIYGCKRMEMRANGCLGKCYGLFAWKRCNVSDILDILSTDDFIKTCLDKMSIYDVVLFDDINRCVAHCRWILFYVSMLIFSHGKLAFDQDINTYIQRKRMLCMYVIIIV